METPMTPRTVAAVIPAQRTVEGAGFIVHRPFPTRVVDHLDPFLLLDEMGPMDVPPGEAKGAPDHPHRGFETVTYLLEGSMEHKDSAGNAGSLGTGDIQWMTAGSGVVHSEMPSRAMLEKGGSMHGFQLWVNLPAAEKMTPPRYQDLRGADVPVVESAGAKVRVIAGSYGGKQGLAQTRIPITYLHATLAPGASVEAELPADANAFVYVVTGHARVGKRDVGAQQLAVLAQDGGGAAVTAGAKGADVLVLAGKPLQEPVWRAGPFVMATREDLLQAFADYQSGRFGQIA
jgi:quercetin 2,3-dioxygenase